MDAVGSADNVNRNKDQVRKDISLVKEQFNQISPENDLKWALIHPREGVDGYDFGPADAYVNFGVSNHMYIVGHTLVWHGQTPRWVFQGTNLPPGTTNTFVVAAVANAPGTNGFGGRRPGGGFGGGFGGFYMNGPRASREELLQRMHDHIFTVAGRYRAKSMPPGLWRCRGPRAVRRADRARGRRGRAAGLARPAIAVGSRRLPGRAIPGGLRLPAKPGIRARRCGSRPAVCPGGQWRRNWAITPSINSAFFTCGIHS